jgi:hypothetical protein
MIIGQILQDEIQDAKRWIEIEIDESTYKRNLIKRVELINWVLEQMKNPDINICETIENKMNDIIEKINKTDSILEADPLDSQLRIFDWIFYQVCKDQQKKLIANL